MAFRSPRVNQEGSGLGIQPLFSNLSKTSPPPRAGTAGAIRRDDPAKEDEGMPTVRKQVVAIYVDRLSGGWIVRDSEGDFWILPSTDHPWDDRQPF